MVAVYPILLVEDNPDDAQLMQRMLERGGLVNRVVVAGYGQDALDILKSKRVCAVILDLALPGMDGLEVLRRMRTNPATRLIPVVVLTHSHEQETLIHSYELGANKFLYKPVDFKLFIEAMRQLGLYWALLDEAPTIE